MREQSLKRLLSSSVLVSVFVLAGMCWITKSRTDELATTLDLVGIPPPYRFNGFCRLRSGDLWAVGGRGHISHHSPIQPIMEQDISDADLLGVDFGGMDSGWIVGTRGTVLHTTNHGDHWARQKSGVGEDLEAVACIDEKECWIVGRHSVVLHTTDAGLHWKRIDVRTSRDFYAVQFINDKTGWIAGQDGVVVRTDDGGVTWRTSRADIILLPNGPFAAPTNLRTINFVNDRTGWVAGAGGIAQTTDGGDTWRTTLKRDSVDIVGIVSHDGRDVWAVNKSGKNWHSTDGGNSWQPHSTMTREGR